MAKQVTEHFEHEDFDTLRTSLTPSSLKAYMKELLSALDFVHSRGIIHRDIKPHNILWNPKTQKMKLIDFGLAELYFAEAELSPKVSSLYFKAPELLMECEHYSYAIDVWSAGIILASIVN